MSRIGLVLGGGGVAGAAYEMATLMALELATGWDANEADVVVGTSAGAYVAALLRGGCLDLDSLVRSEDDRRAVAARIRSHIFVKNPRLGLGPWARHGLLPGVRHPGLTMLVGAPARYNPTGLAGWVRDQLGTAADSWPTLTTVITAYDVMGRRRVAFGSSGEGPEVSLAQAVAASSAIPVLFHPHEVGGRIYVDGGLASGTHADLLLGSPQPLDLAIVVAPMAAVEDRPGAWWHERWLDRLGRRALEEELARLSVAWPNSEVLVLRPSPHVLQAMRPNLMAAEAAVPTFIRTLGSMKRKLADPEVWPTLQRHLRPSRAGLS